MYPSKKIHFVRASVQESPVEAMTRFNLYVKVDPAEDYPTLTCFEGAKHAIMSANSAMPVPCIAVKKKGERYELPEILREAKENFPTNSIFVGKSEKCSITFWKISEGDIQKPSLLLLDTHAFVMEAGFNFKGALESEVPYVSVGVFGWLKSKTEELKSAYIDSERPVLETFKQRHNDLMNKIVGNEEGTDFYATVHGGKDRSFVEQQKKNFQPTKEVLVNIPGLMTSKIKSAVAEPVETKSPVEMGLLIEQEPENYAKEGNMCVIKNPFITQNVKIKDRVFELVMKPEDIEVKKQRFDQYLEKEIYGVSAIFVLVEDKPIKKEIYVEPPKPKEILQILELDEELEESEILHAFEEPFEELSIVPFEEEDLSELNLKPYDIAIYRLVEAIVENKLDIPLMSQIKCQCYESDGEVIITEPSILKNIVKKYDDRTYVLDYEHIFMKLYFASVESSGTFKQKLIKSLKFLL